MNKNIMIVGVGGQGSLLASKLLGHLLLSQGYDVKVSEVHGMSQRGGSVVTYVRYGDKVYSPVIDKGEADFIVSKYKDMIWSIYIKHPWTCIYKNEIEYNMVYYTCHLFNWDLDRSFIENIKHFDFNSISIKRWAKKHNVEITSKMIKDKTTIHLMDYIGIYPKNKEK